VEKVTASAPGKAVISGEYAVLAGSPALSMALDRRAAVTIAPRDAAHHEVVAPGYIDTPLQFDVTASGEFDWIDSLPSPGAFALLEAVWRRAGVSERAPLSMTLDTRPFVDPGSGQKLGIGSSAALAVALAVAFKTRSACTDSVFDIAADAHRAFQGGKGSGVDIATALHGGMIGFRRSGECVGVNLPAGLHYRFFWSGRPAKTRQKIDRIDEAGVAAVDSTLAAAAERVFHLARSGTAKALLSELDRFVDTLTVYDSEYKLGIFAAGHGALVDYARLSDELVYKPCGAGGGDIGIAMATTPAALQEFAAHAEMQGFVALDVRLEQQGVLVEAS
jgi:phosphomevalonate kinase